MPAWNRARYIREALDSLLEDTWSPKEIIVVDDGSTDETAAIVNSFPQVRYIYQEHQGVSVARNTALENSTGDYVTFLDSDDIWVPGRIADSLNFFENNPEIDYILAKLELFLEEGCAIPEGFRQSRLDSPLDSEGTGVLMAKKACFNRVGKFNPMFRKGEDLEWIARASDEGLKMGRIPFVAVRVRIHDQNTTFLDKTDHKSLIFKIVRDSIHRKQNG
jgi:glycosyltransferase involved in cell wall biosynthesis